MTDAELAARVADMLDLTDRSNYTCWEFLAEELQQEVEDDITTEQHYAIAEQVEAWWHAEG